MSVYYKKERQILKVAYSVVVEAEVAKKIAKRLLRHEGISNVDIFFSGRTKGFACPTFRFVKLPKKDCSVGLIIHEVGHLIQSYENKRRLGEKWHTQKLLAIEKKLWRWLQPRLVSIIEKEAN